MIDTSKEILRLADLLKELKSKNFQVLYPNLYDEGIKLFNEKCKELEEKLKIIKSEVKNG